jgi:hypothetical protein
MKITWLNAVYATSKCVKSIAVSVFSSKVPGSIQRISKTPRRSEQDLYQRYLTDPVHFSARSPQGFRASLKGVACSVAVVIGISLSIAGADGSEASIDAIKSLKSLANYQLTDAQYKCHNEIVHRESRWKIDAIGNKSGTQQAHGYYQIKSNHIKGKPYDYQFWMYWYYVAKRYGVTQYDEPNYCNALRHLKTKGWQ